MLDLTGPFHTFEFFPPRTEAGLANLLDRINRLASPPLRRPVAISVTWGAGGATAERSLELAEEIVKMGFEVVLHLTCTNMPKSKVDHALETAKRLGIKNILALRGDPPRPEEYSTSETPLPDLFRYAEDLVTYISSTYPSVFRIGVAGYPTPHPDSETSQSDLYYLKRKVDAGAEFIITQLFYDVDSFLTWVKAVREAGITVPIIPGVMPIQNYASFRRLVKLTQCDVPPRIMADLEPIKADDAAVKRYGATLATDMVRRLMDSGAVQGVHFCTLNLEKSVRVIMEDLGWSSTSATASAAAPAPVQVQLNGSAVSDEPAVDIGGQHIKVRRGSNRIIEGDNHQNHVDNLSVSPTEASQLAQYGLTHKQTVLPPTPKHGGQVSALEDSWDEYPNGRFTDVRSPAYGEIDGWGSGLKSTAAAALREWGTPTTPSDLSHLFTSYLSADPSHPTTPFCDLPLSPESQTILPTLLALNSAEKQYWTVGSQPAVDAVDSGDKVHGWGPEGGYVFQKAFVEFFVPKGEMERVRERVHGGAEFTIYAGNKRGDLISNVPPESVNAVTWGVFPGKEIIQSTIIEQESFVAWKEEAFEIWAEWARLYPKDSAARKLLEGISEEWWLVTVIAHDYKDKEGLWRFLLE